MVINNFLLLIVLGGSHASIFLCADMLPKQYQSMPNIYCNKCAYKYGFGTSRKKIFLIKWLSFFII